MCRFCDYTVAAMCVHIAIPEPTSSDPAYNQRSLPPYLAALRSAGATPILVPLHERQDRVARLLAGVQGILLPGSRFDVDPQRYGEDPIPECGEADPARTAVDELLLQDAFNLHKPILAICHGTQSLNVWLNGSLIQDLKTAVNHRPGREVVEAHPVRIAPDRGWPGWFRRGIATRSEVNSSHHQAIRVAGRRSAGECGLPGGWRDRGGGAGLARALCSGRAVASRSGPTRRAPFPAPSLRPLCRRRWCGSRGGLKSRWRRR